MSVLAACAHKAEWICPRCARCGACCECTEEFEPVHINTKEAALALSAYARRLKQRNGNKPL